LLALHFDPAWRRWNAWGIRGRFEATARRTRTLVWVVPLSAAMIALALAHGRLGSFQVISRTFDPEVFPAAAVHEAKRLDLEGPIFSEFTWNAYIEYVWPERKIFIDGGTDFFGEDILRQYLRVKGLGPNWRGILDKWGISTLLLRGGTPLARETVRDPRWMMTYCDTLAVILRRTRPVEPPSLAQSDSAESRLRACTHPVGPPPADDTPE
jgi:hypothetical protein